MTTLPAATVAPRSPTNLPRNSLSLSLSIAMMKLPLVVRYVITAQGARGRCNGVATALQRASLEKENGRGGAMRARYPDTEGFVERDGVKVGYEVFGSGEPALVFAPTDPLVHSRAWKAQVPYLARTSRVVTIDPRGNGRSDRPRVIRRLRRHRVRGRHHRGHGRRRRRPGGPRRDLQQRLDVAADGGAAPGPGARRGEHRHLGAVPHPAAARCAPSTTSTRPATPTRAGPRTTGTTGCATGGVTPSSSSASCCPSRTPPSCTRTCVGWAMDSSAETNLLFVDAPFSSSSREETEAVLARVSCPVLAIHGREDCCQPCGARRAGRRRSPAATC